MVRDSVRVLVTFLMQFINNNYGCCPCRAWTFQLDRRIFLQKNAAAVSSLLLTSPGTASNALQQRMGDTTTHATLKHPFQYSEEWIGTSLPMVSLQQATVSSSSTMINAWPMGRWPDPILRRIADPVEEKWFGTDELQCACDSLRHTAVANGAVGLAAQQCGVNARIVYIELERNTKLSKQQQQQQYLTMINPLIVDRSPETDMRVWREECLVLPPTFRATVLRDAWVDVLYQDAESAEQTLTRLQGETARALQHELDHDRGILVTDHVSLEELESDVMRWVERPGHDERMARAYTRYFG